MHGTRVWVLVWLLLSFGLQNQSFGLNCVPSFLLRWTLESWRPTPKVIAPPQLTGEFQAKTRARNPHAMHSTYAGSVAISPNAETIAVAEDRTMRGDGVSTGFVAIQRGVASNLLARQSLSPFAQRTEHVVPEQNVFSESTVEDRYPKITYTDDGKYLLVAYAGGKIVRRNARTGKVLATANLPTEAQTGTARIDGLSPDGTLVVSHVAHDDRDQITVWRLKNAKKLEYEKSYSWGMAATEHERVGQVSFAMNSKIVGLVTSHRFFVYYLESGLAVHCDQIPDAIGAAISPDDSRRALFTRNEIFEKPKAGVWEKRAEISDLTAVTYSPDGDSIFAATKSGDVYAIRRGREPEKLGTLFGSPVGTILFPTVSASSVDLFFTVDSHGEINRWEVPKP